MEKGFWKKLLRGFLAFLYIGFCAEEVQAQAVVTDTQSTGKTVKQWFTEVKESKTVVGTMQTVQKTSTAIGTAKKSVSEYVVANKEKLEEKIAKVQEYQKKAEEYKKEYDQYKKQLDENIAKAKELKEQAEDGVETAKETASATKEVAGSTLDAAKDKAGISTDKGQEEKVDAGAEVEADTTDVTDAATDTNESVLTDIQTNTKKEDAIETDPTSSRIPFEGDNTGTDAAGTDAAGTDAAGTDAAGTDAAGTDAAGTEIEMTNNELSSILTEEEKNTFNQLESKDSLSEEETQKLNALKAKIVQTQDKNSSRTATTASKATDAETAIMEAKIDKLQEKATIDSAKTKEAKDILPTATAKPSVVVPTERIQLRKAFTTSSFHRSETLMFAKVAMLNLPDGGTDVNGTINIPKALSLYCGLNSGDVLETGKLDDCLLKLNKERQSAQLFSGSDAPKVYNQTLAQYVAASMAEAYKARQDADSFEENFIDAVDFAPEVDAQAVYDNIVELNKAIDMQMNGLLKVFSSQLMVQSLYNYGSYSFVPTEDGDEDE